MQRSFSGPTSPSWEALIVLWQRITCSGEDVFSCLGYQSLKVTPPGSAKEVRLGVEKKSWIAKVEQAKRYSERAQMVLDTVKVGNTISPT
jgi:hypothetical protein